MPATTNARALKHFPRRMFDHLGRLVIVTSRVAASHFHCPSFNQSQLKSPCPGRPPRFCRLSRPTCREITSDGIPLSKVTSVLPSLLRVPLHGSSNARDPAIRTSSVFSFVMAWSCCDPSRPRPIYLSHLFQRLSPRCYRSLPRPFVVVSTDTNIMFVLGLGNLLYTPHRECEVRRPGIVPSRKRSIKILLNSIKSSRGTCSLKIFSPYLSDRRSPIRIAESTPNWATPPAGSIVAMTLSE